MAREGEELGRGVLEFYSIAGIASILFNMVTLGLRVGLKLEARIRAVSGAVPRLRLTAQYPGFDFLLI